MQLKLCCCAACYERKDSFWTAKALSGLLEIENKTTAPMGLIILVRPLEARLDIEDVDTESCPPWKQRRTRGPLARNVSYLENSASWWCLEKNIFASLWGIACAVPEIISSAHALLTVSEEGLACLGSGHAIRPQHGSGSAGVLLQSHAFAPSSQGCHAYGRWCWFQKFSSRTNHEYILLQYQTAWWKERDGDAAKPGAWPPAHRYLRPCVHLFG